MKPISKNMPMRALLVCASLLLCISLVACSQESDKKDTPAPTENSSSSNKNSDGNSNSNSSTPTVPSTTTAYLQETNIGDNNVVSLIITEKEGVVTKLTVQYGNVEVSGNMTKKTNYTMSTGTITNGDVNALTATFGRGSGHVSGVVTPTGFSGTMTFPGLGEFPIEAGVAEKKTCSSCNGTGSSRGGYTGGSSTSGSSSCSTCTGVGYQIAYKGTYI